MASGFKYTLIGGDSGELTLDGTDTTQYLAPIVLPKASVIAFQIVFTATAGSLNATGTLQETCLANPDLDTDTDWVDSSDITIVDPAGTTSKQMFNIGNIGSGAMRLKFSRSSGTGSVRVYWSIKKVA